MIGDPPKPTFKENLLKPKTIGEFYSLLVTIFPTDSHSQGKFIDFIVECYKRPDIEFQYRNRRQEIEETGLAYEIPQRIPNNEIWNGAIKYLESMGVDKAEIRKLWDLMPNRV